jgi:spore coat protein U-like protein
VTPARSLLIAVVAVVLLIDARPMAEDEQFPRGLMAADPEKKGCTIETRPLAFGNYNPLVPEALDGIGTVIYTCGEKESLDGARGVKNIRIEMSRGASNSYSDRRMTSGQDQLFYQVYLDSSHRTIWGDGSNGTNYYFDPHPPNKTPVSVPAYGRIRGMQDVLAGQYVDVLQVTIQF